MDPALFMVASFFADNPLIAAIAGTVAIAVVVLMVGAGVLRLFRRRRPAPQAAPPTYGDERSGAWVAAEPAPVEREVWAPEPVVPPSRPRRAGFGFGALAVAFLLGLVAGGVGLAFSSRSVATAVATLAEMVEPGATDGQVPDDPAGARPAATPRGGEPIPPDVSAKLTVFVDRLKASLPRAAGPELSLTSVDLDGRRLSLGYAVGRVMAPDETQAFDGYILRTVKSLFCGQESREIRFLSEAGVVFDMHYVDAAGETITRLTVEPGFCT